MGQTGEVTAASNAQLLNIQQLISVLKIGPDNHLSSGDIDDSSKIPVKKKKMTTVESKKQNIKTLKLISELNLSSSDDFMPLPSEKNIVRNVLWIGPKIDQFSGDVTNSSM